MFTRSRSGDSEPASTPASPAQSSPATPAPAEQSKPDTQSAAPPAATGPNAEGAAATADPKTSGEGLPVAVGRALDAKKVVVLLFWNSNAVDDRSVHQSVAKLSRHGGKVAVFDDSVKNLSRYTRVTATAQVTQTPSLVVIDRRGNAQVQTGYSTSRRSTSSSTPPASASADAPAGSGGAAVCSAAIMAVCRSRST